jgi:hypothetical protein
MLQSQSRENAALNKNVQSDCLKCVEVCAEQMISGSVGARERTRQTRDAEV